MPRHHIKAESDAPGLCSRQQCSTRSREATRQPPGLWASGRSREKRLASIVRYELGRTRSRAPYRVVREEDPAVIGGPGQDRRIWSFGQSDVLHARHIEARHAANEPAQNIAVEVFIGQNADHATDLSRGHGPAILPCRPARSCPPLPAYCASRRLFHRRSPDTRRWPRGSPNSS